MQIVIDIPEEIFKDTKKNGYVYEDFWERIVASIIYGTPLPKGHGRLIDADALKTEIEKWRDSLNRYGEEIEAVHYKSYDNVVDEIESTPTIIEADKAESEVT